jgi:hypothetical protein
MKTSGEMTPQARWDEHNRVIRASEIGVYAYCGHAWWLGAVEGVRPDDVRPLQSGWVVHERHGRRVVLAAALTRLSYLLLIMAGLAGLMWLVSRLVG